MDTVAVIVAAVAGGAARRARADVAPRASRALRERIAADGVQIREQEQLAHVGPARVGPRAGAEEPAAGRDRQHRADARDRRRRRRVDGRAARDPGERHARRRHRPQPAGVHRDVDAERGAGRTSTSSPAARSRRAQRARRVAASACNFALADRLPLVYVDGRQLEKVIATLLVAAGAALGARAARPPRSTLATRRGDPGRSARHRARRSHAPLDELDEPSWSGDLAACRQIVEAHGGSLEVERPADGGYRFHLELPVTAGGADTAARRP